MRALVASPSFESVKFVSEVSALGFCRRVGSLHECRLQIDIALGNRYGFYATSKTRRAPYVIGTLTSLRLRNRLSQCGMPKRAKESSGGADTLWALHLSSRKPPLFPIGTTDQFSNSTWPPNFRLARDRLLNGGKRQRKVLQRDVCRWDS